MAKSKAYSGQARGGRRLKGTVVMPTTGRSKSALQLDSVETADLAEGHGTEVVSVTVPRSLVREARARTGKRGFSAFVSRAIHNELVRENQNELIDAIVAERGPLDEERMRSMDRLFGGG